jgi:hypothetical protein
MWTPCRDTISEIFREKQERNKELWIIKKPLGLRMFSLELIGKGRLNSFGGIAVEKISEYAYTINTDKAKVELLLERI